MTRQWPRFADVLFALASIALATQHVGCGPCSAVGCSGAVGGDVELGRPLDELVGGEVRLCRNEDCRTARIERQTITMIDGGTKPGSVACSSEVACFLAPESSPSGRQLLTVTRDIGFEHPDEENIKIEVIAPDGARVGVLEGHVRYERTSVGCDAECSGATVRQ